VIRPGEALAETGHSLVSDEVGEIGERWPRPPEVRGRPNVLFRWRLSAGPFASCCAEPIGIGDHTGSAPPTIPTVSWLLHFVNSPGGSDRVRRLRYSQQSSLPPGPMSSMPLLLPSSLRSLIAIESDTKSATSPSRTEGYCISRHQHHQHPATDAATSSHSIEKDVTPASQLAKSRIAACTLALSVLLVAAIAIVDGMGFLRLVGPSMSRVAFRSVAKCLRVRLDAATSRRVCFSRLLVVRATRDST